MSTWWRPLTNTHHCAIQPAYWFMNKPEDFPLYSVLKVAWCTKITLLIINFLWPSVLWRCWLGGRKGIQPVKTEWWGAGMVICLQSVADLHMAQLMPLLLAVSCFSKIQICFTFLVSAHPGSPGQGAVKRVCVCYKIFHEHQLNSRRFPEFTGVIDTLTISKQGRNPFVETGLRFTVKPVLFHRTNGSCKTAAMDYKPKQTWRFKIFCAFFA